MVATSYQAVSGSGQQGVTELVEQLGPMGADLDALMEGGWEDPGVNLYERPIAFNTLPFAGSEVEGGYTDEEMKLVNESRKILDLPDLAVEPTCVRVPVLVGHGVAATMRFREGSDRRRGDDNSRLGARAGAVEGPHSYTSRQCWDR